MDALDRREWLEADGLGGFASGTAAGVRTRRYHAVLLAARTPPVDRWVLVPGFDAYVEIGERRLAISSQRYRDAMVPDGASRILDFTHVPFPTWRYDLGDGLVLTQRLAAAREAPLTVLEWSLMGDVPDGARVELAVRPFLAVRDPHSLAVENGAFRFEPSFFDGTIRFAPYDGAPAVLVKSSAEYRHAPVWYRGFLYEEERARGLDDTEDLAAPGELVANLADAPGRLALAMDTPQTRALFADRSAASLVPECLANEERRRAELGTALHRAADAYVVRRGQGRTIVAGYPWFTDWGRDTFIALRGLALATGREDVAREVLREWAGHVSEGMLPNRFPDRGADPEYNSADAALWYVVACGEYLDGDYGADDDDRAVLRRAILAILDGYARGTRHGIHVDDDGLLAAGAPGVQLTWMDARVGDWVVTPRVGKPVELQALWHAAARVGARYAERWNAAANRCARAFEERFWNGAFLDDVVDVDHVHGAVDRSLRPNQILAAGGLGAPVLSRERAAAVVERVERELWTPLGLRTLSASDPRYVGRYEGGVRERDGGYHQGTAWPWLIGPFVEAWLRAHGDTDDARSEARARFLAPLLAHLAAAGLGHVSEIADGDPPHAPRGCPFQAWSVGELARMELVLTARRVRAITTPSEPLGRRPAEGAAP